MFRISYYFNNTKIHFLNIKTLFLTFPLFPIQLLVAAYTTSTGYTHIQWRSWSNSFYLCIINLKKSNVNKCKLKIEANANTTNIFLKHKHVLEQMLPSTKFFYKGNNKDRFPITIFLFVLINNEIFTIIK